jgi:uncharacterized protein YllA (UPF0747 family)
VSNILPLTIESLVAVLLLLTILYCVRLNGQLKRLKADESALKATIAELVTATETAERAIAGLKLTVRETDETLGERLRTAERYSADMVRYTEEGGELLHRLAQIAGARVTLMGASSPGSQANPSAPDPKAIMAAARAFAERASARVKGLAA